MANSPSDKPKRSERDQQRVAALLWHLKGTLTSFIEDLGYKTSRARIYSALVEATKTSDTKSVIEQVAKVMTRIGGGNPEKDVDFHFEEPDGVVDTYRTRAETWYLENQETLAEVFMAISSGVTLPVSTDE